MDMSLNVNILLIHPFHFWTCKEYVDFFDDPHIAVSIYRHSTKKRALRASALRVDGVQLRIDF